MHTLISIFGVVIIVILVLAVISIITGLVWIIFPLENKIALAPGLYKVTTPLGGRETGVIILSAGIFSLILGIALDRIHTGLIKKYGVRT
ncbi:hypothetical protein GF312_04620 [Candidatus Poribacteria bacterium]|nr:hypothetical protein [Candidatus Poribacteria bacterium]